MALNLNCFATKQAILTTQATEDILIFRLLKIAFSRTESFGEEKFSISWQAIKFVLVYLMRDIEANSL